MTAGSTAQAQGAGDWYATLFGGVSTGAYTIENYSGSELELSGDPGFMIGATVGRTIAPDIRAEVELAYSDYEFDTYDANGSSGSLGPGFGMTTTYLMGNVWYDLSSVGATGSMTPYVGGGLGLALIDLTFIGTDFDTANALAFQVGGGLQLPVGTGMIDVGYRFKGATGFEAEVGGTVAFDENATASHNLQVGYVFSF